MRKVLLGIFGAIAITTASWADSSQPLVQQKDGWKQYFPLALGHKWTYRMTIAAGKQPLYWIIAEVEKPRPVTPYTAPIHRRKGAWISYNGQAANAQSGEITYSLSEYDIGKNAFKVSASGGAESYRYGLRQD